MSKNPIFYRMSKKKAFLSVILSAVLITIMFYKQDLGLNLLLFEFCLFSWFTYQKKISFKSTPQILLTLGTLLTLIATVFIHSDFSYIWHFISLFVFIGMLSYPKLRSLVNGLGLALLSVVQSQMDFFGLCKQLKIGGKSIGKGLGKTRFFLIPIFIIFVFVMIYSAANPVFSDVVGDFFGEFGSLWNTIFYDFEFAMLMTFLLGIFISNFLLLTKANKDIVSGDANAVDHFHRKRRIRSWGSSFAFLALKNELKAALFLFVSLNIILAIVNGIDVYWVWFNFEWEGQYLKQFVHSGTYLLILSILLSIGLVLYFFRANMNFYRKSAFLKTLSYIWLAQNALLAISVGVRNYWYIEYYALAYKRIGVVLFLLLTIYGLYTVYRRLKDKKSYFYMMRKNTIVFYVLMTLSALVDWDGVITRYNFSHANKSFLHLNFLAQMSDKTLVDMDKSLETLKSIQLAQKEEGFIRTSRLSTQNALYFTPEEYYKHVQKRKKDFKTRWEHKGFLSWNYPEYKTYWDLYFNDYKKE